MIAVLLLALAAPAWAQPYEAKRLTAAGAPEAVGKAVGEAYTHELRALHPGFLRVAMAATRQQQPDLYAQAGKIAAKMDQDDLAEIRGVAEGSGLRYEDVLFLNLFYNLTTPAMGCRQLAVWGAMTTDRGLIHARNLDWVDYPGNPLKRYNLILNVKPERGLEHLLLTWPGLMGALTGTNEAGVTVAFNALPNGPDPRKRGRVAEPTFFTLRRILRDCDGIDGAVKLIREARPIGNGSVMISSAGEKRAVVVEIYEGRVGVRGAATNGTHGAPHVHAGLGAETPGSAEMIGNANHMTREAGLGNVPRIGPADAPTCEVARSLKGPFDGEGLKRVLAHPRVLAGHNILSVVFVPDENRMLLSCGQAPAASGEFKEYPLFER